MRVLVHLCIDWFVKCAAATSEVSEMTDQLAVVSLGIPTNTVVEFDADPDSRCVSGLANHVKGFAALYNMLPIIPSKIPSFQKAFPHNVGDGCPM